MSLRMLSPNRSSTGFHGTGCGVASGSWGDTVIPPDSTRTLPPRSTKRWSRAIWSAGADSGAPASTITVVLSSWVESANASGRTSYDLPSCSCSDE